MSMSMKEAIRKMKEELEKKKNKNVLEEEIKKEKQAYEQSNLSQNEILDQLEEKKQLAEQDQDKDRANMYEIAIAVLKDLWAKKMSEAQQKKLNEIVEKNGLKMQEYLQKTNLEKQAIMSKILIDNLINRKNVLSIAKKMTKESKNTLPFFEKNFGQIGKNIINQFNFEDRDINIATPEHS